MHRVNWDFVSPTSWLGSLVDEELVMGDDTPAATTIYFIPMGQRRSEDEPMQSTGEDEETMEGVAGEGDENEDKDKDEDTEESLDDDFFHDLPMGTRALETQMPANLTPPQQKTKDGYSYFTYSYSRCGTLDDNADLVHSTRRRYEDSAGHLKAVHSRRIGNRTLESTWKKRSEDDEGLHDVKVSIGDVDTFKKAWENTPFGKAEAQARAHGEKHQTQYPDETPAKEIP